MGTIQPVIRLGMRYRNKNNHSLPSKVPIHTFMDNLTGEEYIVFRNIETNKVFLYTTSAYNNKPWWETYEEVSMEAESG